jgi:hypothetical protein
MKNISKRIAIAIMLCALSASAASANVKSRSVTVGQDFVVGGTVVKAGTYRLSFDDEKNELTVSDRKTGQVIAKAQARSGERRTSSSGFDVELVGSEATKTLASVAFPGEKQTVIISDATAQKK